MVRKFSKLVQEGPLELEKYRYQLKVKNTWKSLGEKMVR